MATVQVKVVDISADEISDGGDYVVMTVAEREKLALAYSPSPPAPSPRQ